MAVGFLSSIALCLKRAVSNVTEIAWVGLIFGYSPWHASHMTFQHILKTPQPEQGTMIRHFIMSKQRELDTVAVASALVGSLVASLLSWSWFPIPPYTAKVAMLYALVSALLALGISAQQSIALGRANLHPNYTDILVSTITGQKSGTLCPQVPQSSRLQCFAWQIPTMLVGGSIVAILVGISITVFNAARYAGHWGDEMVTAVCLAISLLFGLTSYFISWHGNDLVVEGFAGCYIQLQEGNGAWGEPLRNLPPLVINHNAAAMIHLSRGLHKLTPKTIGSQIHTFFRVEVNGEKRGNTITLSSPFHGGTPDGSWHGAQDKCGSNSCILKGRKGGNGT
ncbi:hypothetical protein BDZ45DRAFT_801803 [Acephala macrosclerotiorum]|nr:hypothetical protein BDZ45DRAFT_801803 [Acephala macrosclerotiorum]